MTLTAAFNHFNFFRPHVAIAKPLVIDYQSNSPYMVLGVRHNSPDSEIKRAWRKLMMSNHPDLGDVNKTMVINEAYRQICKRRGI